MPEEQEVVDFKRLVLANGRVLDNCECGFYEDSLWCYLKDIELPDAFQCFLHPEDFKTVIFEFGTSQLYRRITYSGFTKLKNITINKESIDVCIVGLDVTEKKEDIYVPEGGE